MGEGDASDLTRRLHRAVERVGPYLARFGAELPQTTRIAVDPGLEAGALASHRYPATVVVREPAVPESVIAHELVHIAQHTLEQFHGFTLLYTLLAEGLADWIAKTLYPEHQVKYEAGYALIDTLSAHDPSCAYELLAINGLPLTPADVDFLITHPRLPAHTRRLLTPILQRGRDSVAEAARAGIDDLTFVTLGEELRACKFLRSPRFDPVRERLDALVDEWFAAASAGVKRCTGG